MEPRLKSGLWVQALIRRCDRAAIGIAVVAHGDGDAGAILLKLSGRNTGCTVLAQAHQADGAAVWMRVSAPPPRAAGPRAQGRARGARCSARALAVPGGGGGGSRGPRGDP